MSVSSCSLTAGEVGAHRTYWKGRIIFSFSEGRLDSSCLKMGRARTSLEERRRTHISHVLSWTRWTQITPLRQRPLLPTKPYLQTHAKNKSNRLTTPIIIKCPIIIGPSFTLHIGVAMGTAINARVATQDLITAFNWRISARTWPELFNSLLSQPQKAAIFFKRLTCVQNLIRNKKVNIKIKVKLESTMKW